MLATLDSAKAVAGDAFAFKTSARVRATKFTPEIPAGTRGYGIVTFADHAHGNGLAGRLAIEPRYLRLADGTHVQVLADPQFAENFVEGATRDLNGALGLVPGVGIAVSGYNALHHGREITIQRGTEFTVLIGDELAAGQCFVPPPSALNVR